MKRLSVVLALVVAGPYFAGGCAQPAPSVIAAADVEAIREAAGAYAQAAMDTAWTQWSNFFTEDAVFLPPNTTAKEGRAAIEAWGRAFPPFTDFRLDPVEVTGVGDLAYVRGRYSISILVPGGPPVADSGKYIEVWRRQPDATWKISRDIFNSDLPVPTASSESR